MSVISTMGVSLSTMVLSAQYPHNKYCWLHIMKAFASFFLLHMLIKKHKNFSTEVTLLFKWQFRVIVTIVSPLPLFGQFKYRAKLCIQNILAFTVKLWIQSMKAYNSLLASLLLISHILIVLIPAHLVFLTCLLAITIILSLREARIFFLRLQINQYF